MLARVTVRGVVGLGCGWDLVGVRLRLGLGLGVGEQGIVYNIWYTISISIVVVNQNTRDTTMHQIIKSMEMNKNQCKSIGNQ